MPETKAKYGVVIAACYGASNTGQLAGAVATELVRENKDYTLVCLPAVALDLAVGLDKVAGAELFVIIEGCPVMCCSKIVEEHAGRKPDIRVEMVEDYGVKKSPQPSFDEAEKDRIKQDVRRRIEAKRAEVR
jgi:uncharacterized metal-binding protein